MAKNFSYLLTEVNLPKREITEEKLISIKDEKTDRETVMEEYYNQEFEVFNINPTNMEVSDLPEYIQEKVKEHPLITDDLISGFPDLILYDEDEDKIAYCEVKTKDGGGVRFSQLKFLEETVRPHSVAFVREEEDYLSCDDCGMEFQNRVELIDHECGVTDSIGRIMDCEGYGFR